MPIKLWGNEILIADGYGGGIAASETCCCTSSSSSGSSSSGSSGGCSVDFYTYVGRAELYVIYEMDSPTYDTATTGAGAVTGDGFVWADVGILKVSNHCVGLASHLMRLYQTNLTPAQDDVFTKYDAPDEADFSGYSSVSGGFIIDQSPTLDANDWGYSSTSTAPNGNHGDQIHNGGLTDNATIYGCFEKISHDGEDGVIVGDWNPGGLTPATNPFPMDCQDDEVEFQITHAMAAPGATTTGNMVVTDIAERWFLHRMPGHYGGGTQVRIHLFTGAHVPSSADELDDYMGDGGAKPDIEATFSGYAENVAWNTNNGIIEFTAAGKAYSENDSTITFTHNAGTFDDDVTGYFLTLYYPSTLDRFLLGAERFDTPDPIVMDTNTDFITIPLKDFLWDANQ